MYNNYYSDYDIQQPEYPCYNCIMYRNAYDYYTPMYRQYRKEQFSPEEVENIAQQLNVNLNEVNVNEFKLGLDTELKVATKYFEAEVDLDLDIILRMGKIVLENLNDVPNYYSNLIKMKLDAKAAWNK